MQNTNNRWRVLDNSRRNSGGIVNTLQFHGGNHMSSKDERRWLLQQVIGITGDNNDDYSGCALSVNYDTHESMSDYKYISYSEQCP
jgi:hypothetical protein